MSCRYWEGGHTALLTDLNQLRGLVQVRDSVAALRLVRLSTLPETCYARGGERLEAEVVSAAQAHSLPNYGIHSIREDLRAAASLHAGFFGVLADRDYQTAGFEPARVERVPGGFRITRWIYWTSARSNLTGGIQRIQEFVGEDGQYRRRVIGERDPHEAPPLGIPVALG